MDQNLKAIEEAIESIKEMIDSQETKDSLDGDVLAILQAEKERLLRDDRSTVINGVVLNTQIVNGKRIVSGGGGFEVSTDTFQFAKLFLNERLDRIDQKQRANELLDKGRALAAQKRKENSAKLRSKAIEDIQKIIGHRKCMTYSEFDEIWEQCQTREARITKEDARAHFREIIDLTRK